MSNPKSARAEVIPQRIIDRMEERTAFGVLRVPRTRKPCDLWLGGLNGAMRGFLYWTDAPTGTKPGIDRYAGVTELTYRIHRLGGGPLPLDAVICHACDVATCRHPEHLFLGDRHMNAKDLSRRGSSVEQGVAKMEVWAQLRLRAERGLPVPPALERARRRLRILTPLPLLPRVGGAEILSSPPGVFISQKELIGA
jgi:hypothetical protein